MKKYKEVAISYCTQRNNFTQFITMPHLNISDDAMRWLAIGYLMEHEYRNKGRYLKLNSIPIVLEKQEVDDEV